MSQQEEFIGTSVSANTVGRGLITPISVRDGSARLRTSDVSVQSMAMFPHLLRRSYSLDLNSAGAAGAEFVSDSVHPPGLVFATALRLVFAAVFDLKSNSSLSTASVL